MGSFGGFEWLIIILVVLLLFGAKRIPELARGLGQGINEFRKASDEIKKEIDQGSKGSGGSNFDTDRRPESEPQSDSDSAQTRKNTTESESDNEEAESSTNKETKTK